MEINQEFQNENYKRALKRVKEIKGFYTHLIVYILVNFFLFVSKFQSFSDFSNLNKWKLSNTLLFWGIGLAIHGLSVFGPKLFLGKKWEENKIKELMEKEKKQQWD